MRLIRYTYIHTLRRQKAGFRILALTVHTLTTGLYRVKTQ
jgi:hypothetical protein